MPVTAPHLFARAGPAATRPGPAPWLPTTRTEMAALGWDACDIVIVTGDAYVDHPSFGMAVMGRLLEAQGFRVGIVAQPDWRSKADFTALGRPRLFFGITAGNMDSMINRYTADRRLRSDDAYTPDGAGGRRPDRAVVVYAQRCREAYPDAVQVLGGIEASLRRIAQYDYWSDAVRRSVLIDAAADILLYGNAERAVAELAHRLASGEPVGAITDIRGTAVLRRRLPAGWTELDSTRVDWPKQVDALPDPYACAGEAGCADAAPGAAQPVRVVPMPLHRQAHAARERTVIRLPSFEKVSRDAVLYAHASRVLHQESNPHNARALVQRHGTREVWVNPPPVPLTTEELDAVFDLPYQRRPHPAYGERPIPAYEMIKTSVNIMRGCFGGCTFCSITEHEGRIIQSRSQASVLREIEDIRDKVPGFTGVISDLGGPTANMYRLNCKDDAVQAACRRPSCVYPTVCSNLETSHAPTTRLYRQARRVPGVKRVLIASGLRYDLAVLDEAYVKELVTHHVGGYLKIAPEHSEQATLEKMMKPGMASYYRFKRLFDRFSREAGKQQYLIPYFIAAHPGCEDGDMLELALWLKRNGFRVDQVQTFYPSPMALATAMYHSGRNPLKKLSYKGERVFSAREPAQRRLHKAFLRYHDAANHELLREALRRLGRADLIGGADHQLVPAPGKRPGRRGAHRGRRRRAARGGQWR